MFEDLKLEWAAEDKRHISARGKILVKALKRRDENGEPVSVSRVAREFKLQTHRVSQYLDVAAMSEVTGGVINNTPAKKGGNTTEAIAEIIKAHRPKNPDPEYVQDYLDEGFGKPAAERQAVAYEAPENAIEAGHVVETLDKQNKKAAKIVLPEATEWSIKLRKACTYVRHAAAILDDAKINDLKRKETLTRVSDAHLKWMEQMERIENFHPSFNPQGD